MEKNKFYTVNKEINGTNYVAQFNGLSCALRAVDQSYIDGTQNTSVEKLANYIFANVIVEPRGLSIDDFESMEEFNEVVAFGREVMQGNFRDKAADKAAAKK
ncbi:hypothetical protein [Phascolarctobacterium sp.]|uniref:hypothetical protein n=1 Tax=Phascolarctobacterium sp. TaxID=2049039 RepID=UPI00386CFF4A